MIMGKKLQVDNSIQMKSEEIEIMKDCEEISDFDLYKKTKYDEFGKIIKFYRDYIEDINAKEGSFLDIDDVNLKFIEYQNIFVNHLISAENITQVDSYYDICIQFIYSLLQSYKIEVTVPVDEIIKMDANN